MIEMPSERGILVLLVVIGLVCLGMGVVHWGLLFPEPEEYNRTTITVETAAEDPPATAEVRIADTAYKQYIGLSRTDRLAEDEGMVFVHDEPATRQYGMRGMDVSIDLIFIDSDQQITTIHSAERPTSIWERIFYDTYSGKGQWVLEVPHGWADRNAVSAGDTVSGLPTAS